MMTVFGENVKKKKMKIIGENVKYNFELKVIWKMSKKLCLKKKIISRKCKKIFFR